MGELKPCPMCNRPLTVSLGVNPTARCNTPDCWISERRIGIPLDDPKQVAAWNTRAPAVDTDRRERLIDIAAKALWISGGPEVDWSAGGESAQAVHRLWAADVVDAIIASDPVGVREGWRPIETAPKDGTTIEVQYDVDIVRVNWGSYENDAGPCVGWVWGRIDKEPLAWRPPKETET